MNWVLIVISMTVEAVTSPLLPLLVFGRGESLILCFRK